jgi:hypothetical protein
MSDRNATSSAMGDIIGSTRQRLDQPERPGDRLKNLVAATMPTKAATALQPAHEPVPGAIPTNYFPQVALAAGITPKRKPQRGPARSLHISMRLSPPERDRLVTWCDDRNLSLPDGIVALLNMVEGKGA